MNVLRNRILPLTPFPPFSLVWQTRLNINGGIIMKQRKSNVNQNKHKSRINGTNKTRQPVKTFYAIVERGNTKRVFTYKSHSRLKAKNHLQKVTAKHDYIITYFGAMN